jgi:hypothetical protein
MKTLVLIALTTIMFHAKIWAADKGLPSNSRETTQGFFSLAGFYAYNGSRLLNTDGTFTNYTLQGYGGELDIRLLDPDFGDIRAFGRYQIANNQGSQSSGYSIKSEEMTFGLKFYEGSHVFLSGSLGPGKTDLSSPSGNGLHMGYTVLRIALGVQFSLTDTLLMGFEADYRNAPVRKSQNPELTDNTYYEGIGGLLKIIWSPPSETININMHK